MWEENQVDNNYYIQVDNNFTITVFLLLTVSEYPFVLLEFDLLPPQHILLGFRYRSSKKHTFRRAFFFSGWAR